MIVATRALYLQSEKRLPHHAHHLPQFIRARLLLEHDVCRQHGVVHSRDEEANRRRTFRPRPEHIAHQLHPRELVVRHVGIEGIDHPVPIRPGVSPWLIVLKAVALPFLATSANEAPSVPVHGEASSSSTNWNMPPGWFCSNDRITSGSEAGREIEMQTPTSAPGVAVPF